MGERARVRGSYRTVKTQYKKRALLQIVWVTSGVFQDQSQFWWSEASPSFVIPVKGVPDMDA